MRMITFNMIKDINKEIKINFKKNNRIYLIHQETRILVRISQCNNQICNCHKVVKLRIIQRLNIFVVNHVNI
jgi:hypothetical protein